MPANTTLLILLFSFCLSAAHALHNVTVDNSSPLITYQGPWPANTGGFVGYDVDDTQETIDVQTDGSTAPSATASFTFTGTAIYYWSPLWPYEVSTMVTLDNESPVVVSLVDSGNLVPIGSTGPSKISQIRWGRTGLSNAQHTLTMSLVPQSRYIVVDALTYTALDPSDIAPPPVSALKSTTESGASPLVSSSSPTIAHPSSSSVSSVLVAGTTGGFGFSRAGETGPSSPTQTIQNDPHSPSTPSGATGSNHSQSKTVIIVASTLGSLFFIAILAILVLILRHRWIRRRDDSSLRLSPSPSPSLTPFLVDTIGSPVTLPFRKRPLEDSYQRDYSTSAPTHSSQAPTSASGNPHVSMAYTTAPPPYQPSQDTPVA